MKMMLEMKQIGIFCFFLAVQVIVKMFPLYGKEQTKNCRKNMSNNKLRDVCENDKLKKKEREATEKINDIEPKQKKGQGTKATLQTKIKIEQGARIGIVPYKGKRKVEKLRKRCNSQRKLLIKINKPNALNKRRKNHLSSTPDSSLSMQTHNMSTIDCPVEISIP